MVEFVADIWHSITLISSPFKIEKASEDKKKSMIQLRPTIDLIDTYFNNSNLESSPIDKDELFYLVCLFHANYIKVLE